MPLTIGTHEWVANLCRWNMKYGVIACSESTVTPSLCATWVEYLVGKSRVDLSLLRISRATNGLLKNFSGGAFPLMNLFEKPKIFQRKPRLAHAIVRYMLLYFSSCFQIL